MESRFIVGQKVRVHLQARAGTDEEMSCRALVAYFNEEDATYDVVYETNSYGAVEEGSVNAERITVLEDFEVGPPSATVSPAGVAPSAFEYKDRGNKLFQMKDYDAAKEQYSKGLRCLVSPIPGTYSQVLVVDRQGDFVSGTVSSIDDDGRRVDIIYDQAGADGNDEEDGVTMDRIVVVVPDSSDKLLQVIMFMNLAKVSLKLKRNGWAVRYSSSAIGVVNCAEEINEELSKKLLDAYFFRSKVFLIVNRPGRALADANQIEILGDMARAESLRRQISQHKDQRRRQDRKLARDVAKWVESAMEMNAAAPATEEGEEDDY